MSVITRSSVTVEDDGLAATRRALRISGAELERNAELPRGVISAVECGRLYPYPKLRAAVTAFLSDETGEPFEVLHARLFPGFDLPERAGEDGGAGP